MQTITTIGLDIAKSVFQVHGVDAAGQVVIRRQLKRRYVLAFFTKLPSWSRPSAYPPRSDRRLAREYLVRGDGSAAYGIRPFLVPPTSQLSSNGASNAFRKIAADLLDRRIAHLDPYVSRGGPFLAP